MRRRTLVRSLALALAGLAGCTSADDERGPPPTRPPRKTPTRQPTTEPTPEPTIPTPTPRPFVDALRPDIVAAEAFEGEDGLLTASVPVTNDTDGTVEADLVVTVVADDAEYTARRRISVPSGGTETITVTFDTYWDTVARNGQPRIRSTVPLEPGASI